MGAAAQEKPGVGGERGAVHHADDALAPPMFITIDGAPPLSEHRPDLPEPEVHEVFRRKRAMREERIAALVAEAEKEGRPAERILAAIIHDAEHAPYSTNRAQLAEIGVVCPSADLSKLSDAEVKRALWRTIYGLAYLGIFLCGTDHLDDRVLLKVLCSRILEEAIRDVPPSRDMSEFIDLTPCRGEVPTRDEAARRDEASRRDEVTASSPDGLEGPFDREVDDSDLDELDGVGRMDAPASHVRRDELLPRPRRDPM